MEGIEFEESTMSRRNTPLRAKQSSDSYDKGGLIGLLIKWDIVKNPNAARILLLFIAIVATFLTIYIFINFTGVLSSRNIGDSDQTEYIFYLE